MKRLLGILLASALMLALSASCSKGGKVIPRGRMSRMYAEMLMTDQWISSHHNARRQADTSFVYGAIFEKYGYDADDWRASIAYYLHDPQRYARMFAQVSSILKKREAELVALDDSRKAAMEYLENLAMFEPEKIYTMSGLYNPETFFERGQKYYVDTNGGDWRFDPSKGADTIYQGPVLIWPEPLDSVKFRADSVALADSLAKIDSLARLDSIARADDPVKEMVISEPVELKPEGIPSRSRTRRKLGQMQQEDKRAGEKQSLAAEPIAL